MSGKLLWSGLTLIMALDYFWPGAKFMGDLVMIAGAILMWLDK